MKVRTYTILELVNWVSYFRRPRLPWIFDGKASSSLKVSSLENFTPSLGLLLSDYYYYYYYYYYSFYYVHSLWDVGWFIVLGSGLQVTTGPTILDKNVKKNARCMCNLKILPSKARFTQDTPPSSPKKQCWSVARTFLLPTKQHWPGRGGGRGHHGAKFAG